MRQFDPSAALAVPVSDRCHSRSQNSVDHRLEDPRIPLHFGHLVILISQDLTTDHDVQSPQGEGRIHSFVTLFLSYACSLSRIVHLPLVVVRELQDAVLSESAVGCLSSNSFVLQPRLTQGTRLLRLRSGHPIPSARRQKPDRLRAAEL